MTRLRPYPFLVILALLCIADAAQAQIKWRSLRGPAEGTATAMTVNPKTRTLYAAIAGDGVYALYSPWSSSSTIYTAKESSQPGSDTVHAMLAWSRYVRSAATGGGLFVTTGTVTSWVASVMIPRAYPSLSLLRSGDTLLAGTAGGGVFLSVDSGTTFTQTGFSTATVHALGRTSAGTVYAATDDGVWRSQDNGRTWSSFGRNGRRIVTLAADAGYVYAATVTGIARCTEGSSSWTDLPATFSGAINVLHARRGTSELYAGSDSGLYVSTNAGMSWALTDAPTWPVISIAADSAEIAAGYREVGIASKTSTINTWTWISGRFGSAGVLDIDLSTLNDRIYTLDVNGMLKNVQPSQNFDNWLDNTPDRMLALAGARTLNLGDIIHVGTASGAICSRALGGGGWITTNITPGIATGPVAIDDNNRAWAATDGAGIARTMDGGAHWTLQTNGLPDLHIIAITALPEGRVLAACGTRGVYRSDDLGATWTQASTMASAAVTALASQRNGYVMAATSVGMHRSTDGGVTWVSVTRPGTARITSLLIGTNDRVFAGTFGEGVYYSTDMGSTWQQVNNQLGNLQVTSLASDFSWRVHAGTLGGLFMVDSSLIPPPPRRVELQYPVNGKVVTNWTITLTWKLTSSRRYQAQLSTDSTFTTTLVDTDTLVNQEFLEPPTLQNNTKYFWRVRIRNGKEIGPWSQTWSFTVAYPKPDVPVLADPADGAIDIPVTPTLTWKTSKNASLYDVQLARTPAFDTIAVEILDVDTYHVTVARLSAKKLYYWRVRGKNQYNTGDWSLPWKFTTALRVPPAPMLLSPVNGAPNAPTTANLRWYAADNAEYYRIQMSTDPGFFLPPVDIDSVTGVQRQIPGLAPKTTWYWRVAGRNALGLGLWSEIWRFTTDDGAPSPPLLVSPSDAAQRVAFDTTLVWNRAAGATRYRAQVATTSDFASPVLDRDALADTTLALTGLARGTAYWWRVRSSGAGGIGAWSEPWTFRTALGVPAVPVLRSPADGATGVDTRPVLAWSSAANADAYRVQLASDAAFTAPSFDTTTTALSCIAVAPGDSVRWYWRVSAQNAESASAWSAGWSFTTRRLVLVEALHAPEGFVLSVHPNPAAGSAWVDVALRADADVRVEASDLLGRTLAVLHDGRMTAPGAHLTFSATGLPAGIVQIRCTVHGQPVASRLLVIVR